MKAKPIEFTGDNDLLIFRVPDKVISYNREIIVPFSHEVVFVQNGIIMETLQQGKHILNPKKFGFLGKMIAKKKTEEVCYVYYINKTVNQKILWGTSSPMNLFDESLNIPISMGANGIIEIKVNNARKFMGKIMGSNSLVTIQKVEAFFNEQISLYLKDTVSQTLKNNKIGFYEIDSHLVELSLALKTRLEPIFDDYGVSIEKAVINGVFIPNETMDKLQAFYFRKKQKEAGLYVKEETEFLKPDFGNLSSLFVCKNCGANLTADAKICPECKFEVEDNKGRFCFYCGKKLLKSSNICSRCGKEN